MKYVSIFSGIEAATVAWHPLGWEPLAFSEIDPFPSTVLQHHYPDIPNLGDITKIDWSPYVGAADIVVGGSPCQSFSVAGKREGLAGASGLMFEYIRAVRELRPRWFVWENVPGAFTSERGEAYRQLLSEMDALGYGLAWRVLDAQFFGVAQRRERVFLVGSLGTMRCAEVLFERESLSWNHQSSRQKRQALTEEAQGCVGEADHDSGCLNPGETQSRRFIRLPACIRRCPREKSQGKIRKAFSPSSVMILPVFSPHDTIVPPALTVERTSSLTNGIKYSFARRRKPAATGNSSNRTM